MPKVRVAAVDEIGERPFLRVDADGRPLLLSRRGESIFAIEAICSHAGGRLEDGDIEDGCVICPIHGAIFDLASGKVSPDTDFATDLESFPVEVAGSEIFVEMPARPLDTPNGAPQQEAGVACPWSGAAKGLDFDPMAAELRECPFDLYARARHEMPIFYSERFDLWVVTRYQDIVTILKDVARFSSAQSLALDSGIPPEVQSVLDTGYPAAPTMVTADPPVHTRYRELVGKAFTSRHIAQIEPRMREIANKLVDGFEHDGQAEIVRRFAYPFPMEVIAEILGVPAARMDQFKRWSDDMSARFGPLPLERHIECAKSEVEFQHYFAEQLDERRRSPRRDLLTELLGARVKGELPLNTPELLSILKQLLIGGNETSTNLIGSMMLLLMNNPGQLQAILNDRSLEQNAVEEALRLDSPVQGLFRSATEDVEIGDVKIPKGAHLELLYASGNRDDARFGDPDAFDVHRSDSSKHMAFGFGIHFCIGAPLARTEGRIALDVLLNRLHNIRLTPGQHLEHHPHFFLRGLKELQLEWNVAGTEKI
ncbi:MAG TPA: cytochrome P450 [Candidatus Binataceae bacterium]|nr:cytochrome P450 [Candidatus Binataceae bacterium]